MKNTICLLVGLCAALSPSAVSASQTKCVHTLVVSTFNPSEHTESYILSTEEESVLLPASSIWSCKTEENSYSAGNTMVFKNVTCNLKSNRAIEATSSVMCGGVFKNNMGKLQLRDAGNKLLVLFMVCEVK